jgi:release factor glutamine methyltransferase
MNNEKLFNDLRLRLENKLRFLEDKPEETVESSIKALWLTAFGTPKSAEEAVKLPLPELSAEQKETLNKLVELRLNNTPLAHITKRQSFMGIELLADNRALIPRKETEILGRKALEVSIAVAEKKPEVKVIDVCCGAGNLGLAIASFNQKAFVSSTDLSPEAVSLTRDNISFLNLGKQVNVWQGDLFAAFESDVYYGKADLIVCNPPYISSAKVKKMDAEINVNEPDMAFDGGMFGTKVVQKVISESPKFLLKGGWLLFEIGLGQGEFMIKLCQNTKLYEHVESLLDTQGNIRAVAARK